MRYVQNGRQHRHIRICGSVRVKKLLSFALLPFSILPKSVMAHCPLCTLGAGAAAVGATYLGVHNAVVGIFIGAFAASLGLWVARVVKKKYVPFQKSILTTASFASVVIPLLPMMKSYAPFYLSWFGVYGSLFNRTYLINLFLVGSLLGAVIVAVSPLISKGLSNLRNGKTIPFQGIGITLLLLLIIGAVIQLAVV